MAGDRLIRFDLDRSSLWLWIGVLVLISAAHANGQTRPGDLGPMNSWVQFKSFSYAGSDPAAALLKSPAKQYLNPILPGFYPDPSICRVGDQYYLANSSFMYFPGIPIWTSKNLVDWKLIGYVLNRPSDFQKFHDVEVSRGVYAPTIRYHDGQFYVICTLVGGGGNFYVTAKNITGPWSQPHWLESVDGIDPSLFFDDDGKAYVIHCGPPPNHKPLYGGHRTIRLRELDLAIGELVGPEKILVNGGTDIKKEPIWIEGPHLFKRNGRYYLIAAEGGTEYNHSEVVFRADSVWGPYVPFEGNPVLTQRQLDPKRKDPITCTGHADFVEMPNGDWWTVFLGCQPYEGNLFNTGRETFLLPVKWESDWPIILPADRAVPRIVDRPDLPGDSGTDFLSWSDKFRW